MNKTALCLNAAEVSERTGLSLSSVRKLTRSGEIPHIRVGRRILYPAEALAEWLTQKTVGGLDPEKDGALSE
ncbi:helix-turn-helix domain-containing protein [Ruminococcus sp. YRD2003]|uniref:helix-turn-helix domain-containing protein n=1 Tax=Ruminococcus sp. YRD2003 TaxID=1452313 RepID=UPI0009449392